MRVGFACQWDRSDRKRTWSHTPYHLLTAMQQAHHGQIIDLPLQIPRLPEFLTKLWYARPHPTGLLSVASWTPAMHHLRHSALRRVVASVPACDAILTIGEHGPIAAPQFVYQDQSVGQFIDYWDQHGVMADVRDVPSMRLLRKRTAIERDTYGSLAGIFTMSHWNARHVVATQKINERHVHVVGAGINVASELPSYDQIYRRLERPFRNVLFVGRHFERKGGDIVIAGIDYARRISGQDIRLTVAGPTMWPLAGEPPAWVTFIGDASLERVQHALRDSDLLALPSRFEAYGIAVLEALAAAVPVLGRNDFAMPEMIEPGQTGALVNGNHPEEFAEALLAVLGNEHIAVETLRRAPDTRAKHSWTSVARTVLSIMQDQI